MGKTEARLMALGNGQKTFIGPPCKNCDGRIRYALNNGCVVCQKARSAAQYKQTKKVFGKSVVSKKNHFKTKEITRSRLMSLLKYDKSTGLFSWKLPRKLGTDAGMVAGSCSKNTGGRVMIGIDGKIYPAHRLAWLYVNGPFYAAYKVVHINGKKDDNRIENLRLEQPEGYIPNKKFGE